MFYTLWKGHLITQQLFTELNFFNSLGHYTFICEVRFLKLFKTDSSELPAPKLQNAVLCQYLSNRGKIKILDTKNFFLISKGFWKTKNAASGAIPIYW